MGAPALANPSASEYYESFEESQGDYYREESQEDTSEPQLQTTTGLTQRSDLIGACRYSPESLDVFEDAGRVRRLLTIVPDTPVTLTGVVGNGIAEIRHPANGWISTLTVEPCSGETTPSPSLAPDDEVACYRTLTNVTVRTQPSRNARALGYIQAGGIAYPTAQPPNEAISGDGRIWIEIDNFLGSDGWIAITGANGMGSNVESLPEEECDRR